ncbi:hypothetical protein [Rahnella inusitata]|uniref:hypothetical protein n=1 Tax=Rahnella inusitata TaxID=58169 RepID=UPI0039AF7B71
MRLAMGFALITLFCSNSYADGYKLHPGTPTFQGKHFDIDIQEHCQEGEVTCPDVSYDSINKKTGARLHLKGRVMFNPNNYNFQGYIFDNGDYSYVLNPNHSKGTESVQIWNLNVFYKDKVIAFDEGIMQ